MKEYKEKKIDWGEVWKPIFVGMVCGYYYNSLPNFIVAILAGLIFLVAYRQAHNKNI